MENGGYQFGEIEKMWHGFWEKNKTFRTEDNYSKPKFYILDMFPSNFRVKIELRGGYIEGKIALYNNSENKIVVYADKVTDGVLAHEVAHVVICRYFVSVPPPKIQEILAQYVDTHLWTDY